MSKYLNMLFINSDPSEVDAFSLLSENYNWNIESSSNSFQAIQRIKENPIYNALIIDHAIQPLTPIQLIDYLTIELNINIPAVLIIEESASEDLKNEELFLVMKKPITKGKLDKILYFVSESVGNSNNQIKPYSLDYLKQLSDNDTAFILESLQIFKDSVYVKINELKQAIKNLEYNTAREIAHNIKPSFEMLDNDYSKVLCNNICYEVKDQEISFLAEKLSLEYTKIVTELKKEFPNIK